MNVHQRLEDFARCVIAWPLADQEAFLAAAERLLLDQAVCVVKRIHGTDHRPDAQVPYEGVGSPCRCWMCEPWKGLPEDFSPSLKTFYSPFEG